jgi:hypothetical protein
MKEELLVEENKIIYAKEVRNRVFKGLEDQMQSELDTLIQKIGGKTQDQ